MNLTSLDHQESPSSLGPLPPTFQGLTLRWGCKLATPTTGTAPRIHALYCVTLLRGACSVKVAHVQCRLLLLGRKSVSAIYDTVPRSIVLLRQEKSECSDIWRSSLLWRHPKILCNELNCCQNRPSHVCIINLRSLEIPTKWVFESGFFVLNRKIFWSEKGSFE